MMKATRIFTTLIAVYLLSSCAAPRQITYFQDMREGQIEQKTSALREIRVRPNDKFSILVNSQVPQISDPYNLPFISRQLGSENSGQTAQGVSGYTVNSEGYIDFPVLGAIKVLGMTREEIAAHIKGELQTQGHIKDPVVTVEFMNLGVSVLGEVSKPGRYNINKDNITVLDALSMAGDLTIYGKRDKVMVLREEKGVQTAYEVNLNLAGNLFSSPVYYLQQNDVVYVEPNDARARQSTVNGNNVRSTSFWLSLASLLTTVTVLFVK